MSRHTTSLRDRTADPAYDAGGDQEMAAVEIAGRARARHLRRALILANIVAWLIIIVAVKWLVF